MTKKVMAMAVSEVLESLVIIRSRLYLLLASPNLPSIQLRSLSSNCACFLVSWLTFVGGLPSGGPLILIPLSLHHFLLSLVR
jgi:hypothetical protein